MVAVVLAVPVGVLVADHSGWPASFVALAAMAVVVAALVGTAFPRLDSSGLESLEAQAAIVRRPLLHMHLLLSAVLGTAMFAAYTYLAALLETVAGFDGRGIAAALMGFGVAGVFGNWIAGRVVGRGPTATTTGVALVLILATAAVSLAGETLELLLPVLAVWGAAHTAAFLVCQVRVMLAAPAFASSLNISAANVGIAAGAMAGGWIVDRWSIAAIGFGSAALAAGALGLALAIQRFGEGR